MEALTRGGGGGAGRPRSGGTPQSGEPPSRLVLQALRRQADKLVGNERWEAAGLVYGEAVAELEGIVAAEAAAAPSLALVRAELLSLRAECVTRMVRLDAEAELGLPGGAAGRGPVDCDACQSAAFFLQLAAALEAASCLAQAAGGECSREVLPLSRPTVQLTPSSAYEKASAVADGADAERAAAKAIRLRAFVSRSVPAPTLPAQEPADVPA